MGISFADGFTGWAGLEKTRTVPWQFYIWSYKKTRIWFYSQDQIRDRLPGNLKGGLSMKKYGTLWLCVTALLMAMNVILSSFGIPVPGGHLYLNDVVICTGALLMDPVASFIVGGVGAFLGDLFFYPTPMFVSLAVHGLQAIVISLMARRRKGKPVVNQILGVSIGAVIMVVGYTLGRAFLYSTPEYAMMKLPYQILQAATGAILGMILVHQGGLARAFERLFRNRTETERS